MTVPYKEIFQRVHDTVTKPEAEKPEWKDPKSDAIFLAFLAQSLGNEVRLVNDNLRRARDHMGVDTYDRLGLPRPQDVCTVCASFTWGRPSTDAPEGHEGETDFTRRRCSECGELRPNPRGEVNGD